MPSDKQPEQSPLETRRYDFVSGAIILLFLALLFRIRHQLPVMLDSWYHLAVIRAFSERGFSLQAWWEMAPYGRPHLYAPLLHLIYWSIMRVAHLDLLDVARVYDVVTFPLVLLAGWWASRLLYGSKAAFITLLLLAMNIGLLFPCSLIMMPGTYAMILWPYVLILVLRKNTMAAAVMLALMCWFHFAVASVAILSLIVLACFRREYWKTVLVAVPIAAILFSPWLIHLVANREFLHTGVSTVTAFIPMFSVLAGILGVIAVWKYKDKEALAMLSIIIACSIFLIALRERFWTYGGYTFAILGGYGIERCFQKHARWAILVLTISCLSITPFFKRWHTHLGLPIALRETPLVMATPLFTLCQWQSAEKIAEIPKPIPPDIDALAAWVEQNIPPDDVIITDDMHLGTIIYVLTGRRATTALWDEVVTADLKARLAHYYQTSPGFIILTSVADDVNSMPNQAVFVVEFGRFRVFKRAA